MSEKGKFETGFSSDARKDPRRVVFVTRKTSAKVSGDPGPQVMAYPHLMLRESIAFQVLVVALVAVALLWDAPLEQLANPLLTPNPAKAPWYFLGLQELLHYFPPFVAGILIPTLVIIGLIVIPYFHVNIQGQPMWSGDRPRRLKAFLAVLVALAIFLARFEAWTVVVPTLVIGGLALYAYRLREGTPAPFDSLRLRPVSWWVMTWFIFVAVILTLVGTFFRGPGWSWVWPWGAHAG